MTHLTIQLMTISTHWMKYLPFILVGAGFVLAVFYVFKRDHILKFVVDSMTTEGKPDSKKMSGFVLVVTLILGFFICIYYSKDHEPPEYYVWVIAGLIASFYGIREVSRFVSAKYNGNGNGHTEGNGTATSGSTPPSSQPVQKNEEKKSDDIG